MEVASSPISGLALFVITALSIALVVSMLGARDILNAIAALTKSVQQVQKSQADILAAQKVLYGDDGVLSAKLDKVLQAIAAIPAGNANGILDRLEDIESSLALINQKLDALRVTTSVPGRIKLLKQIEVKTMPNAQWGLTFSLPGPSAVDVAIQRLTLQDNQGGAPIVKDYPATATQSDQVLFDEVAGLVITGLLVDIDAAGNASAARDESFTIVDNVAPPVPGDFGIVSQVEIPAS